MSGLSNCWFIDVKNWPLFQINAHCRTIFYPAQGSIDIFGATVEQSMLPNYESQTIEKFNLLVESKQDKSCNTLLKAYNSSGYVTYFGVNR